MAISPPRVAMVVLAMTRLARAAEPTCPSPGAIAAELERLPESGAVARLGQSEVTVAGSRLRIVLRDSRGEPLGAREVEAPPDCRQRAAIAAVVLAAWSHAWAPVVPAVPAVKAGAFPSVSTPSPARRGELGLQGTLHHDGRRMAPGAALLAGVELADPLEAGVIVDFATTRGQPLGPGTVGYSFVRVGAGLVYRARPGSTWIDAGIFPQVVRLAVTPRDLPASRATALWSGGIQARVRLGLGWGWIMPFVSASAGRRFVRDRLTLDDDPGTTDLSPWDLELGVGVALRLGGRNG